VYFNVFCQTHKYIVQAVVVRDSWPVPETAWPHIQTIRSTEKLEADPKPGSAKKSRGKGAASKKGNTPSTTQMGLGPNNVHLEHTVVDVISCVCLLLQVDVTKPHWILRVATSSNVSYKAECYSV